jgi:hypothetical protein
LIERDHPFVTSTSNTIPWNRSADGNATAPHHYSSLLLLASHLPAHDGAAPNGTDSVANVVESRCKDELLNRLLDLHTECGTLNEAYANSAVIKTAFQHTRSRLSSADRLAGLALEHKDFEVEEAPVNVPQQCGVVRRAQSADARRHAQTRADTRRHAQTRADARRQAQPAGSRRRSAIATQTHDSADDSASAGGKDFMPRSTRCLRRIPVRSPAVWV